MSSEQQDYEDLVEKLFDDRLSGDELQQLNLVLRQSSEARDHYWHLVMLEGYLADLPGWIAGQQYATELAFSQTLEAFIEMEDNAEAQLQTYPPASDAPPKNTAKDQPITWQDVRMVGGFCLRSLARQKAVWGVAAAAVICIVALVYANWFSSSPTQQQAKPIADSDQREPASAPLPVAPVRVATVLNHYTPSGYAFSPGAQLAQGRLIELSSGSAIELAYASGARVILQGPGEFELHSPERVGMQHGRISVVVPPLAKGFTVSTAEADFIDHGTEFALTLDKEGHGEVIVLDGLIEAKPSRTQTEQPLDQAQSIMLQEGFAGRLAPDEVIPTSVHSITTAQAERYPRHWDDVVYRPDIRGHITYTPSPPASLEVGQANSTNPMLIPEKRGVVLAQDLHLNSDKTNRVVIQKHGDIVEPDKDFVIAAGTKLNSFLIHFDIPEEDIQAVVERDFQLQFNGRIVAVIEMHKYQIETDDLFGLESVQYPSNNLLRGASDPPGHPHFDYLYVSDDLRTLSVKMRLRGMDQIRVLVENTDP